MIVYKYLCIREKMDVLHDSELNTCIDRSKASSLPSMKRCLEAYEKEQIDLANEYNRLVGGKSELSQQVKTNEEGLKRLVPVKDVPVKAEELHSGPAMENQTTNGGGPKKKWKRVGV